MAVDVIVPFITGVTTGGLSCMAVQGGLLANTIAHQTEKDIQQELEARQAAWKRGKGHSHEPRGVAPSQKAHAKKGSRHAQAHAPQLPQPGHKATPQTAWQRAPLAAVTRFKIGAARPIILFLGAKLIAYTLLGFLLGALGSVMQLTPITRAAIQIVVGVFMLGSALNMLHVHPIFRYFAIEPPRFITRYIRRVSKNSNDDVVTPAFLGALTVLIPCGVTQTMMALAIGAANPWSGAAILFSFIIGTSPLFFALAYLMRKLGQKMEGRFMKFAAIAVLILGVVAINAGLNLMGSPLSLSNVAEALLTTTSSLAASGDEAKAGPDNVVTVNVLPYGYQPNAIKARAGSPVHLKLVTNQTYGCVRSFTIPSLGIQGVLPETGETPIDLPAQAVGTLRYACGMGMYSGRIDFADATAFGEAVPGADVSHAQPKAAVQTTDCDPKKDICGGR